MSEFFKSKKKFGAALGALLMAVTLLVGSFAYFRRDIALTGADPTVNKAAFGMPGAEASSEGSPSPEPSSAAAADASQAPLEASSAPQDAAPEAAPVSAQWNVPAEMRGTFLVPGVDFLATKDTSTATIQKEIDKAFASAKSLDVNSIIIDTEFNDMVIYQTADAPELSTDFDIMGYIVDKARSEGFYTYAIFNASHYDARSAMTALMAVGAGTSSKLASNLGEFVAAYSLDGVLLDGYAAKPADASYANYLSQGGGIGFDNFLRQSPAAIVKTASKTIRKASPQTQVGLITDAVWEAASVGAQGAKGAALSEETADAKRFIERGYLDFFAVKAYSSTENKTTPFEEIVNWWAEVALGQNVPMYVVHATDKLFTNEAGWGTTDQIIRQLDTVANTSGVRGSIFNDLAKLSANKGVANDIQKVQKGEVNAEQVLAKLEMTKPAQSTFTTSDPQVTFTGASDPAEAVKINGTTIRTDASGYFTTQFDLKSGLNTFDVSHKGQIITYQITRKIEVLKDVSPKGNLSVDGGTSITISAFAYEESSVYAVVNGVQTPLKLDSAVESESTRDGFFRSFSANYTVPAGAETEKDLGKIVVYAEYDGQKSSIDAASVKVNPKAPEPEVKPEVKPESSAPDESTDSKTPSVKPSDGVAVRITADQAITYPPDTLNNIPLASYYPLPAGAMDYAVGKEISFSKDGKTYTYTKLASGLRVETKDLTAVSEAGPENNAISALTLSSDSGYTYVRLPMTEKVAYSVGYASSGIKFTFHYTKSVPSASEVGKNPLFTAATWSGQTLTLSFGNPSAFMGYKAYYEGNALVLRFNNPPSSLSGARIAIDPGHGGADKGASGFLSEYYESVITAQIAGYLAEELQNRGATVNLLNSAGTEGPQRKQAAENWEADFLVSIHANSAPNINAVGSEAYYFHPFSQLLAKNASSAVSGALGSTNRGAKQSYYHVTLSSQMPSVLIETGFLTNQGEYEKLINSKYQRQIAVGVVDALAATIKGSSTAGYTPPAGNTTTDTSTSAKSLSLTPASSSIQAGKTTVFTPEFTPTSAKVPLTWQSDNSSVASVDANGTVTGLRAGSAKITAATADGKYSASSTVTVTEASIPPPTSSAADSSDIGVALTDSTSVSAQSTINALILGQSSRLFVANQRMETVRGSEFTWESDNPSVLSVASPGVITTKGLGDAKITAKSAVGTVTWTITVAPGITDLQINYDAQTNLSALKISSTTKGNLTYTILPANARHDNTLTWKSDRPELFSIDAAGYFSCDGAGTTTVTLYSYTNPSISKTIPVEIS